MTKADLYIRPMNPQDRPALIALWHACELTRPWNDPEADVDRAIGTADAVILIAKQGQDLIGSAMVGFDGHRGWIYYFAVAPERRRQGVGRRLFDASEAWLKSRGAPKVQLMVRDSNEAAIGFYEALGLELQPVVTLGRFFSD